MSPYRQEEFRRRVASALRDMRTPEAVAFCDRIELPAADGTRPCWGTLADNFVQAFATDDACVAAWQYLVASYVPEMLLMGVERFRSRPLVLAEVVRLAARLPPSVQCFLVALDEAKDLVPSVLEALHPAAQRIFASPEKRVDERAFCSAVANGLLSLHAPDRTHVPSSALEVAERVTHGPDNGPEGVSQ